MPVCSVCDGSESREKLVGRVPVLIAAIFLVGGDPGRRLHPMR